MNEMRYQHAAHLLRSWREPPRELREESSRQMFSDEAPQSHPGCIFRWIFSQLQGKTISTPVTVARISQPAALAFNTAGGKCSNLWDILPRGLREGGKKRKIKTERKERVDEKWGHTEIKRRTMMKENRK
eukprot:superscaffoldBa00011363_g25185